MKAVDFGRIKNSSFFRSSEGATVPETACLLVLVTFGAIAGISYQFSTPFESAGMAMDIAGNSNAGRQGDGAGGGGPACQTGRGGGSCSTTPGDPGQGGWDEDADHTGDEGTANQWP